MLEEPVIPVRTRQFSIKADFVFLTRTDGLQFPEDKVLHSVPKDQLPPRTASVNFMVYHCPINMFNANLGMDGVHAVAKSVNRSMVTSHRCWTDQRLYCGSSGAPYIISNHGPLYGMVYGMHVQSISTAMRLADYRDEEDKDADELMSEESDNLVGCNGFFGEAIILSAYTNLTEALATYM